MGNPKRFILDANIAVKWFIKDKNELYTDIADGFLSYFLAEKIEVYTPHLMIYEFCHVFYRAVTEGRITQTQACKSVDTLFDLPITFCDRKDEENATALRMAIEYKKSAYDMSYLWWAEKYDCMLLTADKGIVKNIGVNFPRSRVLLIEDMQEYFEANAIV